MSECRLGYMAVAKFHKLDLVNLQVWKLSVYRLLFPKKNCLGRLTLTTWLGFLGTNCIATYTAI